MRPSVPLETTYIIRRPFVKRFALCHRTVVLSDFLSVCLSVTLVYCGQTVGRIKAKLGTQAGLVPGHIASDGDASPTAPKGHSPQLSTHFCCGQTAGWIKMALGMEVGLAPGDIVLDGDPAPLPQKRGRAPSFRPIFIVAKRLHVSRCHLVWR